MSDQNKNRNSPEHEPVPQDSPEGASVPDQAAIDAERVVIDSILQPVASDTSPDLGEPRLNLPAVEAEHAITELKRFQKAGGMVTRLANAPDVL